MLRKKTEGRAGVARSAGVLAQIAGHRMNRRSFLRNSGLGVTGLAAFGAGVGRVKPAAAQAAAANVEIRKSVCTHCSVGCTVE
ncbi:MAG: hypothetical protein CVT80_12415, partial [Alphaproteobacteria bacterium HGW-Alphaproteobacteria-2]